ncbi:MAG: type II toxin-antitoxin system VapC family toxin [Candidatus Electrothrix scaldis]|jgi:PIN domain nuclease of toxin-antitoxin system|nr:MAG: type II toxin-antitoxin system VapC family toxin [Candidatus Electrothrix sp. GW3-3]
MRYLLDTHIWLWCLLEPERLDETVVSVIEDQNNDLFISPITIWETLILAEKGRIDLGSSPLEWIDEALQLTPVQELPLSCAIAVKSRTIELPHQDPADRFIAATAWEHDLILITEDGKLNQSQQVKLLQRHPK